MGDLLDLDLSPLKSHIGRSPISHWWTRRQQLGELDGGDTSFLLFETTNFPKPKIQRRCEAAMLRPVTPLALNSGETVVPQLQPMLCRNGSRIG